MKTEQNLTEAQQKALDAWEELRRHSIFIGATRESLAQQFACANELAATEPDKAHQTERALFAICGISTPPPD